MNMKVAVDARPLGSGDSVRGIGVYTRELLKAFKAIKKQVTVLDKELNNSDLAGFDLVHFTSFNPFTVSVPLTKPKGTKFVLTIYDLIPLIYPAHYPPGVKGAIRLAVNKYLIKKNVDAILTISETSKKDVCRFLGVNPDIVHVVYLAPRPLFKKEEIKGWTFEVGGKRVPKTFALYVGDVNYNKNIPVLVDACRITKIPLVIAGKQAYKVEEMDLKHPELKHLKGIDWSGVIRVGFVPEDILVELYNSASVYIQPSLYEGFGLPVLEAFACGVPVVAGKTQALVEIGEGAAFLADPADPKDFAEKIKSVLNDKKLAGEMVKKGYGRVKDFTWEKTARETYAVYETVINKK